MDKIRILCYGDSNTWGYISGTDHLRYSDKQRWTKVLGKLLGRKYEIIEEGLNSRTLISNDLRPGREGRNGYEYLLPCLDTHAPIDLVILMLGTNELKKEYNKSEDEIGNIFENFFVKTIFNRGSKKKPKLIIVAPPVVDEKQELYNGDGKYTGASIKSLKLNNIYKNIANKYDCIFISNDILKTGIDGIHITLDSHLRLAKELKKEIKKCLQDK